MSPASPWWKEFHDAELNRLIALALASNVDVKRAQAVVAEARASVAQAMAGGMPQIGGSISGSAGRVYSGAYALERYGSTGFDASWEIDLWGKNRRSVEAAKAGQASAQTNVEDARLAVLAEVARNYLEIRGAEARVAAIETSIASRRKARRDAETRLRIGDGTTLEVLQAETSVAEAESGLAAPRAAMRVAFNAIAILCGVTPAELGAIKGGAPGRVPQARLPDAGLPADLVRRRPDVRAAERQLAQAVAQVGVAVADKYPSLSLVGNVGLSGNALASIMAQPLFLAAPRLSLPILDGGRREAQVKAAEAKAEEGRLGYRAAVLRAIQDVEDAMARLEEEGRNLEVQRRLAAAAERQVSVAQSVYLIGGASFLPVLDAQRSLDAARIALSQSETDRAIKTVALYKALGGGYAEATETPRPAITARR